MVDFLCLAQAEQERQFLEAKEGLERLRAMLEEDAAQASRPSTQGGMPQGRLEVVRKEEDVAKAETQGEREAPAARGIRGGVDTLD